MSKLLVGTMESNITVVLLSLCASSLAPRIGACVCVRVRMWKRTFRYKSTFRTLRSEYAFSTLDGQNNSVAMQLMPMLHGFGSVLWRKNATICTVSMSNRSKICTELRVICARSISLDAVSMESGKRQEKRKQDDSLQQPNGMLRFCFNESHSQLHLMPVCRSLQPKRYHTRHSRHVVHYAADRWNFVYAPSSGCNFVLCFFPPAATGYKYFLSTIYQCYAKEGGKQRDILYRSVGLLFVTWVRASIQFGSCARVCACVCFFFACEIPFL